MRSSRLPARLALLLVWGIPGAAGTAVEASGTEPVRLVPAAEEIAGEHEEWFGIYAGDDKLGYLRTALDSPSRTPTASPADEPGREASYRVETETHLKVVTMGERREMRSVETLYFAAAEPWPLVAGVNVTEQGPYRQEVHLERRTDGYFARIDAAGSSRVLPVPDLDFTLADYLTPEIWLGRPRQADDQLSTRSFTLGDLQPAVDTYTVTSIRNSLVDGVPVEYYEVDLHSSVAGPVGTVLFDLQGRLVSGTIAGAFELRRESEALATDFDHTADVYLLGMAPVDEPLGDTRRARRIVLGVEGDDPGMIPTAHRQSLERDDGSGRWLLKLGDGYGALEAADPDDLEAALEESVEHPIRDEAIRALAREATEGAETDRERVEALVAFVDRYLADSYSAEPLTVLDMLSTREGDCTEHALLFTTLARAIGLPTREVTGLLYMGDDAQAFGGHAWNEVVLDGHWMPVDATWGEMEINPGHIRFGPRTGSDASAEALFSGFEFELVEIERSALAPDSGNPQGPENPAVSAPSPHPQASVLLERKR